MAARFATSLHKFEKRFARHAAGVKRAWRDSGVIAREGRVSRIAMLVEAAALAMRGRMALDTYFHYRLFEPGLTAEAKRRYLSEAPRANERLWSALTPRQYRCLYDNKIIFHRFFKAAGLPLAALFGLFDPTVGRTEDGQALRTEADLGALLQRRGNDGFVFKPVEGVRGHLTFVFRGPVTTRPGT